MLSAGWAILYASGASEACARAAGERRGQPARGPRSVLRHLPQPADEDRGPGARRVDIATSGRARRNLGSSRAQAAHPLDAAAGNAAPDEATYDGADHRGSRPSSIGPRRRRRIPGGRCMRRLNRSEYAQRRSAICSRSTSTSRRCCRRMIRRSASTTTPICSSTSPALLERYLVAADRVSALAVGEPRSRPDRTRIASAQDRSQNQHIEGLPLGTVGGLGRQP